MINASLLDWLKEVSPSPLGLIQEIQGDASFRRYFRLKNAQQSYIVMDASLQMDCFEPYVAISKALCSLGVAVPTVMAHNDKQGYMLISDFGDRLYLKELCADNADSLYKKALDSLSVLQACKEVHGWSLPAFDQHFMQRELAEFKCWFVERYMKVSLSEKDNKMLQMTFASLTEAARGQTQVFIHRDYHSANLMILPHTDETGVLDFQDACIGPITYDLVSLLRDCYIDWPEAQVYRWVSYYYDGLRGQGLLQDISLDQFHQWFDWMGIQRHLKAAFIFARKYLRDHTTRYLQYLPRTLNYVVSVSSRYPEFHAFHEYMQGFLPVLETAACEQ